MGRGDHGGHQGRAGRQNPAPRCFMKKGNHYTKNKNHENGEGGRFASDPCTMYFSRGQTAWSLPCKALVILYIYRHETRGGRSLGIELCVSLLARICPCDCKCPTSLHYLSTR